MNQSNRQDTQRVTYTRARGRMHRLASRRAGHKDFLNSLVSDGGIDIRVDWDGASPSMGRFEVRMAPDDSGDDWQACPNIDIGAMNDLVSPREVVAGDEMSIRIRRGPDFPGKEFQVQVLPIAWRAKHEPGAIVPEDYIAERGVHYDYPDGVSLSEGGWRSSTLRDGVQGLDLALEVGRVYELHVRLQDPGDPTHWLAQDPIVRTDHGGSHSP